MLNMRSTVTVLGMVKTPSNTLLSGVIKTFRTQPQFGLSLLSGSLISICPTVVKISDLETACAIVLQTGSFISGIKLNVVNSSKKQMHFKDIFNSETKKKSHYFCHPKK